MAFNDRFFRKDKTDVENVRALKTSTGPEGRIR